MYSYNIVVLANLSTLFSYYVGFTIGLVKNVTDALSTILRLLGEELEAANWLIKARSRMEPVEPCDEG